MQPRAIYGICNTAALAIYGIEYGINDKVLSGFIGPEKAEKITRNTIYTNAAGRMYFKKYGTRYYLDEFVRC